jgi:hypothetical protein
MMRVLLIRTCIYTLVSFLISLLFAFHCYLVTDAHDVSATDLNATIAGSNVIYWVTLIGGTLGFIVNLMNFIAKKKGLEWPRVTQDDPDVWPPAPRIDAG